MMTGGILNLKGEPIDVARHAGVNVLNIQEIDMPWYAPRYGTSVVDLACGQKKRLGPPAWQSQFQYSSSL